MKKQMMLKTALLGFLMVTLCGCSGATGNDSAFSPIYINKADQITDPTARQILQHNELGRKIYGW